MSLRWPLSRGSQFKLHFHLGWREIEDRASVSTSPLFRELLINNIESRNISNKNNMHVNAKKNLKTYDEIKNKKKLMFRNYLINRLILQK